MSEIRKLLAEYGHWCKNWDATPDLREAAVSKCQVSP